MKITYDRGMEAWVMRRGKGMLCSNGKSRTVNGVISKEWKTFGNDKKWLFRSCYDTAFTLSELKKIVAHMEKLVTK